MDKRKVILVTDGDSIAVEAVKEAAQKMGGRCISASGGNPTILTGDEIVELIKTAPYDPVVVMVDDRGHNRTGKGEEAMDYILNCDDLDVLGVIAVASNTKNVRGIKVDFSIDKNGEVINRAVDKYGNEKKDNVVIGDTVDIINDNDVPIVVGIGDPGKMDGHDSAIIGAPVISKAMEEIIKRHGGFKKRDT